MFFLSLSSGKRKRVLSSYGSPRSKGLPFPRPFSGGSHWYSNVGTDWSGSDVSWFLEFIHKISRRKGTVTRPFAHSLYVFNFWVICPDIKSLSVRMHDSPSGPQNQKYRSVLCLLPVLRLSLRQVPNVRIVTSTPFNIGIYDYDLFFFLNSNYSILRFNFIFVIPFLCFFPISFLDFHTCL